MSIIAENDDLEAQVEAQIDEKIDADEKPVASINPDEITNGAWQGLTEDEKLAKPETKEDETDEKKEEKQQEEKQPEKEPVKEDNGAYARMRRAEKELQELRKKQAEIEAAKTDAGKQKAVTDAEPDRASDPDAWYEWNIRRLNTEKDELQKKLSEHDSFISEIKTRDQMNQAKRELAVIENDFVKETPDYEKAVAHMAALMIQSERYVFPHKSEQQIINDVEKKVLIAASEAWNSGVNPAQALYDLAKSRYNYDASLYADVKQETVQKQEVKKPDLKVISDAKKRSVSGHTGGKSGKANVSIEAALEMTNAEFQALPESEKARLLSVM